MDQASNEYSLYIPRVALSSSSSSSKGSSRLNEFKKARRSGEVSETSGESESEGIYGSSTRNYGPKTHRDRMYSVHKAPKRGSNFEQTSSASSSSNHSNYSVNSLLLSVKNLENFNKSAYIYDNPTIFETSTDQKRQQMLDNIRNILAIDDISIANDKTKDTDELSTVSSITNTNFTVVTFNDATRKTSKSKAICRRSHQVTILILVMSFVFLAGISGLVCMLEMRYSKMPR